MSVLVIGHWSLVIHWTLVIGHWSLERVLGPWSFVTLVLTSTAPLKLGFHVNRTGHQFRVDVDDTGERLSVLEFEPFQPEADRIAGRGRSERARGDGPDERGPALCLPAVQRYRLSWNATNPRRGGGGQPRLRN